MVLKEKNILFIQSQQVRNTQTNLHYLKVSFNISIIYELNTTLILYLHFFQK